MLVLSPPLCSPPKVCVLGVFASEGEITANSPPKQQPAPSRATLGDHPLQQATATSLLYSNVPRAGRGHGQTFIQASPRWFPPQKEMLLLPTPSASHPPTPNTSHGGAGRLLPPQLAQSCWVWGFHGAEHTSNAGGSSLGQLFPWGLHTCPEMAPMPGTQGLVERCWVLWTTLETSGSGDIRTTLTAGTRDSQGLSREPSWLSDPGGNTPNAVIHVRNNS